jgi:hypothetical protein
MVPTSSVVKILSSKREGKPHIENMLSRKLDDLESAGCDPESSRIQREIRYTKPPENRPIPVNHRAN